MSEKKSLFVIGDSISIHYGPYLRKAVDGVFNYDRKRKLGQTLEGLSNPIGANGGDSIMVLQHLQEELEGIKKYEILLFNCGLHDIKRNSKTRKTQVDIQEYERNLNAILRLTHKIGVCPIWVSTTPVDDDRHNAVAEEFKRYNRDVIGYNNVAKRIMKENSVSIIDLYTFSKDLGKDVYCDHVHFKEEVRALQGVFIAGKLFDFR